MVRISQHLRNVLGDAAKDLESMFEDQAESIQLRALESAELRFGARLDRSVESLRSEIRDLRDDMDRKFASQATEMDRRFADFLVLMRAEFDSRVGKAITGQTRWIAGLIVVQSVAILGYLALR